MKSTAPGNLSAALQKRPEDPFFERRATAAGEKKKKGKKRWGWAVQYKRGDGSVSIVLRGRQLAASGCCRTTCVVVAVNAPRGFPDAVP